jgi:hypothetical protein
MQTLNNLKRMFTLTREALIYIEKYQRIYKRVLKEAKKRDNDSYVIVSGQNKSHVATNKQRNWQSSRK